MKSKDIKTPQFATLTVREAAKMLGIGERAAYQAVRTGQIPSVRFGCRVRIPVAALERLLAGGISEKSA